MQLSQYEIIFNLHFIFLYPFETTTNFFNNYILNFPNEIINSVNYSLIAFNKLSKDSLDFSNVQLFIISNDFFEKFFLFSMVLIIKFRKISGFSKSLKINPFSPSFTKSRDQPLSLLTMTGKPAAIASFTTKPHGSLYDGKISKSPT